MYSTTAQIDIMAPPPDLWDALTSPARTPAFFAGLRFTSTWRPEAPLDAHHGDTHVSTGVVVVADAPALLVYRLENPVTGDVDCWVSWQLSECGDGLTRVVLTTDTIPGDPPVDSTRLLSALKTYLEAPQLLTSRRPDN